MIASRAPAERAGNYANLAAVLYKVGQRAEATRLYQAYLLEVERQVVVGKSGAAAAVALADLRASAPHKTLLAVLAHMQRGDRVDASWMGDL